jgi:hypothetical protein
MAMRQFRASVAAAVLALGLTGVAYAASDSRSGATVSKVTVTFSDSSLKVTPTTPGAGPTTFVVRNGGKKVHVLVVKGPGLTSAHTGKIAAGKTGTLNVTLRSGSYVLSDPVGLGEYNVMFLQVLKPSVLQARGDGSVVNPDPTPPPMCGVNFTP